MELEQAFGGAMAVAVIVGIVFFAMLVGGIVMIVFGFMNMKGVTDGNVMKPVLLLIGGSVMTLIAVIGLIFAVVAAMMLGMWSIAA